MDAKKVDVEIVGKEKKPNKFFKKNPSGQG